MKFNRTANKLRKDLSNKEVDMEVEALRELKKHEYTDVVALLSDALQSNSFSVRSTAIEVLGGMGDERAVGLLIPALKDHHYEVRYIAAETLGAFKSTKSIRPLINSLDDKDAIVRLNAAESLGRLKARKAIPQLIELLDDPDELVRGYAAEALGELGSKHLIPILEKKLKLEKRNAAKLRILEALYKLGDQSKLAAILQMLKAKNYRVRCATASILREIVNDENTKEIIQTLKASLQKEPTIAAKSSIIGSIREIEGKDGGTH